MPISFGLTSNLSISQNLSVGGSASVAAGLTLSDTTASTLLYGNAGKVVASVTLASNLSLTTGTLALAAALTGINSVTSVAGQNLVLALGTGGTALTLANSTLAATFAGNSISMSGGSSWTDSSGTATISGGSSGASLVLGAGTSGIPYLTGGTNAAGGRFGTEANLATSWELRRNATTVGGFYSGGALFALFGGTTAANHVSITSNGNLLIGTTTDMTNTTGGLTVAATGSGATATAVNTGGLRSANFGLSTVSGGPSYFGGDVNVGNGVSTAAAQLQVGNGRSGSGYALLDLVGDTTYSDYGTRLARGNSGANSTSTLSHRGTGDLEFTANDAAALKFYSNGALVMGITSPGVVNIPNTTSASSSTVGALTVGNGTAATNVAIGGGNINAGGTGTFGGAVTANSTFSSGVVSTTAGGYKLFDAGGYFVDFRPTAARSYVFEGASSGNDYLTSFTNAGAGKHNLAASGTLSITGAATFAGATLTLAPSSAEATITSKGRASGTNPLATTSRGGSLTLTNLDTTDNNAEAISFHNSNDLAIASIVAQNVSHTGRTGKLYFNVSNGAAPVEAFSIAPTGAATFAGAVTVSSSTASTGVGTGALQVAGGVGIADKLWIGGAYTSTISAGINVTGVNIPAITLQSSHASGRNYFIGSNYSANGILSIAGSTTAGGAATNILANFDSTNGTVAFPQSSASTGVGTGALQVAGGIYAGAASVFGAGITTATASTFTGDSTNVGKWTVTADGPTVSYKGGTVGAAVWNRFLNSAGTRRGYYGYASGSSADFTLLNEEAGSLTIGTGSAANALVLASTGAATFAGAVTSPTITHTPAAAPSSPATGWIIYVDSGDGNKLKAKASTGTVVTLGTP